MASSAGAPTHRRSLIDEAAIPRPAWVDLDAALLSGDDYELLFTGPPESSGEFDRMGPTPVTQIGEMVAGAAQITLRSSNGERPLDRRGWEHPIPGEGREDG